MRHFGGRKLGRQALQILGFRATGEVWTYALPVDLPRNDDVRQIAIEERLSPSAAVVGTDRTELGLKRKTGGPVVDLQLQAGERGPRAPRTSLSWAMRTRSQNSRADL